MKTDTRKLAPSTQEELRRKAITAINDGMTQTKAAEVFGVAPKTIWAWLKAFREGGEKALAARKRGPKTERATLQGKQATDICKMIRDKDPEQLKLPCVLWTADAVRQLIQRQFKIRVSERTVRRYLAKWGFTPQKPARRAYERDDEAVKEWLEQEYPAIREAAKQEKALIYWGDEMGVRSDHQAGRSYAPKGKTPVVAGTGQRFSCNVVSALTNRGHLSFMVFKKGFTAPVFIRFLRRLVKESNRKVFLIVDNHPVHRSKKVRAWLEKNADRIRLYFLPPYSPDLNPDEMLNQDVKSNAVGRKRAKNRSQLMGYVRRHLERRRAKPEIVKKFFHAPTVRYAAR
jgi:transposase